MSDFGLGKEYANRKKLLFDEIKNVLRKFSVN